MPRVPALETGAGFESSAESFAESLPLVLNALLARAKRLLRNSAVEADKKVAIEKLMLRYNTLLHRALSGHAAENALDEAEELLSEALASMEN